MAEPEPELKMNRHPELAPKSDLTPDSMLFPHVTIERLATAERFDDPTLEHENSFLNILPDLYLFSPDSLEGEL